MRPAIATVDLCACSAVRWRITSSPGIPQAAMGSKFFEMPGGCWLMRRRRQERRQAYHHKRSLSAPSQQALQASPLTHRREPVSSNFTLTTALGLQFASTSIYLLPCVRLGVQQYSFDLLSIRAAPGCAGIAGGSAGGAYGRGPAAAIATFAGEPTSCTCMVRVQVVVLFGVQAAQP